MVLVFAFALVNGTVFAPYKILPCIVHKLVSTYSCPPTKNPTLERLTRPHRSIAFSEQAYYSKDMRTVQVVYKLGKH